MKIQELVEARKKAKDSIKKLEKEIEKLDAQIFAELEPEAGERIQVGKELVSIVRGTRKVWDLDKVYEFTAGERQVKVVDEKTGEIKRLELFSPNDSALKELAKVRQAGELYKACFYTKMIKPFVKIEKL